MEISVEKIVSDNEDSSGQPKLTIDQIYPVVYDHLSYLTEKYLWLEMLDRDKSNCLRDLKVNLRFRSIPLIGELRYVRDWAKYFCMVSDSATISVDPNKSIDELKEKALGVVSKIDYMLEYLHENKKEGEK